jgi:hypothetical protein
MSSSPSKPIRSTKPTVAPPKLLDPKSKLRQPIPRRKVYKDLQNDVDEIMKNFKVKVTKTTTRVWNIPKDLSPKLNNGAINTKTLKIDLSNNVEVSGDCTVGKLLDGDYDPEASQASFQDALLQWRSGNHAVSSTVKPYVLKNCNSTCVGVGEEIETQTEVVKERVVIEGVKESYFDKLKRSKMIDDVARFNREKLDQSLDLDRIAVPDLGNTETLDCDENNLKVSQNPDYKWDESDEEALEEIFSKSKTITLSDLPPAPSTQPHPPSTLTCTDITKDEEDVIMDALSRGIMVECVPSFKLSVILA